MPRPLPLSSRGLLLSAGFLLAGVFVFMVNLPGDLASQEVPPGTDRWNRAALEWIGFLRTGSFQEAGDRVDPAVPEGVMGPDQLSTLWAQLSAQLGTLESVGPGMVSQAGEYHVVRLPATFERQSLILQVTLTDSLLVSGMYLVPSEPPPYEAPGYVHEDAFEEVEVAVGADPWLLPGVLSIPKGSGPFAAIVLVHGSGPNDRDETIGGHRPFKDLAGGLASRGIAVLRYDKRTKVHGKSLPPDIGLEDEVVLDALDAVELARGRPEIDPERVFLLGHSLGGIMAPEIGRRDGRLAGMVLLAAPGRPFFECLRGQLEYLLSLETDPASPARAQTASLIELVDKVEAGEVPDDRAVMGAPPSYWRELAGVDPVAVAKEVSGPIFALQGGRDYQSTSEDLSRWQEGLGGEERFSSKFYPSLSHLFTPGAGMATPEEYAAGAEHVAEEVILDLVDWIRRNGG